MKQPAHPAEFLKFDSDKPRLDLIPGFDALVEVGKVATLGAHKYAEHNWRKAKNQHRYSAALLRHLFAWLAGQDADPESGLSHLAHAAWNCLALLQLNIDGTASDDRGRPDRKPTP